MNKLQTFLSWLAVLSVLAFYIILQIEIVDSYRISSLVISGLIAANACLFYYLVNRFNYEKAKSNKGKPQEGRKKG